MHGFNCLLFCLLSSFVAPSMANKGVEAQLYEDLLFEYNKIPIPVKNVTDVLMVDVGASLIRIIDVDEKNQVLTTNLWLEMRWNDTNLRWSPLKYGGIRQLHIPSTDIWLPDFVLYNNAAGDPDITIFTDALVMYDGRVYWQPPAIYKSFCSIDVKWFPYDQQNCTMKFGVWSYTGFYVDLHLLPREDVMTNSQDPDYEYMENGMDLSFFYKSAEWDLLSLTSAREAKLYASCCGPEKYVHITYEFLLRRKTKFFTCNLIIPCFLISFLTTFVFYLSDHKITFSISILVTLTVFFLVLIDIMPPTSLVVPMFGRYLVTTMILVALSTMVSVVTVNLRFRNGTAYQMSPWIKTVFLRWLPKILLMKRPEKAPKPVLRKKRRGQFVVSGLIGMNSPTALSSVCPSLMRPYPFASTDSPKTPEMGDTKAQHFRCQTKEGNRNEQPRRPTTLALSTFANNVGSAGTRPKSQVNLDPTEQHFATIGKRMADQSYLRFLTPCGSMQFDETEVDAGVCPQLPQSQPIHNRQMHNSILGPPPSMNSSNHLESHKGQFDEFEEEPGANNLNQLFFANLIQQVHFIADHFRRNEDEAEISDDWTFVAMVLDRLFLIIFSVLNVTTFFILLEAPSLRDDRQPLNVTVPTKPLGQANLFSIHNH